jgi:hypothetical protein
MGNDSSVLWGVGAAAVALLVAVSLVAGVGAVSADSHTDENPEASVDFDDQTTEGDTVTVDEVTVEEGGFVAIHDSSLLDGEVVESVIGVSEYLEAGTHEDVEVTLFEGVDGAEFDQSELDEDSTLIAMPHRDTDGDEEYDFVENDGGNDGPYTEDGEAVVDDAHVDVAEEADDEEGGDEADDDDSVFADPVELSIAGLTISVGPPEDVDDDGIYNDLNGDGEVTMLDAVLHAVVVTAVDAGELELTDEQADAVDVDGDGDVDYDDAQEIAMMADMGAYAS